MKGKPKKNKPVILLIDGNNLLHRCYHKFSGMVSKSGIPSSMVFGYPYTLRSLVNKFKPQKVYNVFDGGRDKNRLNILPEYKEREPKLGFDIDDFRNQKNDLMDLLPHLRTYVVYQRHREADDLIYQLVRKFKKDYQIIIVSSDKDFNQLVDENTTCFNPYKGILINHKNMKRHYNYDPHECVDYLILDGDNSDNIPGYKGMGNKTIRKFLDEYSSIKEYLKGGFSFKRLDNKLLEVIYKRNKYLIDLAYFYRKFYRKNTNSLPITKALSFGKYYLTTFCDKYDINIFLKSDFQKHFKSLK